MRITHWIGVAILAFSAPAQAQMSADEMYDVLNTNVNEPAFIENVLDVYSVPPRLAPLFREHLSALYGDDVLLRALAEELVANSAMFSSLPKDQIVQFARDFGAAWFQDKAVEGVKRLPVNEQRAFMAVAADVLSKMPAERCAANLRGTATATESAADEIKVLATMSDDEVAAYLALLRQSVTAEITEFPIYVPLTVTERQVAEAAFGAQFLENLEAHPDGDGIMEAADMGPNRRDDMVCALGVTSVRSAIQVEGQTGAWVLRFIME